MPDGVAARHWGVGWQRVRRAGDHLLPPDGSGVVWQNAFSAGAVPGPGHPATDPGCRAEASVSAVPLVIPRLPGASFPVPDR